MMITKFLCGTLPVVLIINTSATAQPWRQEQIEQQMENSRMQQDQRREMEQMRRGLEETSRPLEPLVVPETPREERLEITPPIQRRD
jgi:hypothetical protein